MKSLILTQYQRDQMISAGFRCGTNGGYWRIAEGVKLYMQKTGKDSFSLCLMDNGKVIEEAADQTFGNTLFSAGAMFSRWHRVPTLTYS